MQLAFQGSPPHPLPLLLYFLYSLTIIYSVHFPLFFQFSVKGAGAGFFWRAGLVAGLQVGWALGCSGCLGLGSAVPVPQVPGYPTFICDADVNYIFDPGDDDNNGKYYDDNDYHP